MSLRRSRRRPSGGGPTVFLALFFGMGVLLLFRQMVSAVGRDNGEAGGNVGSLYDFMMFCYPCKDGVGMNAEEIL